MYKESATDNEKVYAEACSHIFQEDAAGEASTQDATTTYVTTPCLNATVAAYMPPDVEEDEARPTATATRGGTSKVTWRNR